jgi:glycosyltransferase involved in cell wall biosynthesis
MTAPHSGQAQRLAITLVAHDVGTPGGMEHQLAHLATGLLHRGHRVTVIARTCVLPPHPGLRHVPVRVPKRPFALAYPWFALAAALRLRRHRDGLVHTTGALVPSRADVSTIHLLHAAWKHTGVNRASRDRLPYRLNQSLSAAMSRAFERWCYRPRVTRRLVAVSDGLRREIATHMPGMAPRTTVIRNGVDVDAFRADHGLAADPLVAVFVGGDWERKGLRFAVEALRHATPWHLLVVGRGDVARYRDLAASHGVADRVHFLGPVGDPQRCYAAADAFVLPSIYETFSLVAHEAAACGLPLLATRVSGIDELVEDGSNGWFVQRDAGDIATRLRALDGDAGLRARMGQAARAAVERLTWEAMVDGYERLYTEISAMAPDATPASDTTTPNPAGTECLHG